MVFAEACRSRACTTLTSSPDAISSRSAYQEQTGETNQCHAFRGWQEARTAWLQANGYADVRGVADWHRFHAEHPEAQVLDLVTAKSGSLP